MRNGSIGLYFTEEYHAFRLLDFVQYASITLLFTQ